MDLVDKDFSRAYKRALEKDRFSGQKIYLKSLKEAISSRYITSTLMETKKFGACFFFEEKGVHVVVDFSEKLYYITQIKRLNVINETSFGDLVKGYSNKSIITLRVYILEDNPEFVETHTTSCGIKIVIATEDSLDTNFSEEVFKDVFEEIRNFCNTEKNQIFINEHSEIVLKAENERKHADASLDHEDTIIAFREKKSNKSL